jgi:hypothetical protein
VRIFSSGRHAALNSQPWALLWRETPESNWSVDSRFQTESDALCALDDANLDLEGGQEASVEYAPIAWDDYPLTNVPNPVLVDLRSEDGGIDADSLAWWVSEFTDFAEDELSDHWLHAHRVTQRYIAIFGKPVSL